MNKRSYVTILLIITGFSFLIYASSSGVTGATKMNGNGCDCHGSASSAVMVSINGPDALAPGAIGNYSVTITGGPLSKGGTNIAASAGILTPLTGEGLKKTGDELTHTTPKAPVNNTVTFQFTYTAPAEAGSVTLFANGNSVNGNGQNSQDQWNFAADKIITVSGSTGVKDNDQVVAKYILKQNYPNPFNPSTIISFRMAEAGFVTLKIFDVLGNEVGTLINEDRSPGEYTVPFSAAGLSSGIYYYQLKTKDFVETKKMILEK